MSALEDKDIPIQVRPIQVRSCPPMTLDRAYAATVPRNLSVSARNSAVAACTAPDVAITVSAELQALAVVTANSSRAATTTLVPSAALLTLLEIIPVAIFCC